MLVRRTSFLLGACALLVACGSTPTDGVADGTLPLSGLPSAASSTSEAPIETIPDTTLPPGAHVGDRAKGNRVILIGDSVLAGTAQRYGGEMCKALVPLGWQMELDAETGRFVPWGNEVLDDRLKAGWDAAVIFLGNNYLGDKAKYRFELERMVKRLSSAEIVLVRVTEFMTNRQDINAIIDELATQYPNVSTLDWAAYTRADPRLVRSDHLHPTDKGRQKLADELAKVMGQAPATPGDCLDTKYTDDSRSPVTGTTAPKGGGGGGGSDTTGDGGTGTTGGGSDTTGGGTDTTGGGTTDPTPTPTPTPDPTTGGTV